jgi:hypothetical protein
MFAYTHQVDNLVCIFGSSMRRVQIHLDEELDRSAAAEASRRGISKAALIRQALARELETGGEGAGDPWDALSGWLDDEPVADLDEVIYGAGG